MKTICTTNFSGYENILEVGKEYEVLDIQDGIFAGDYYVTVPIGLDKNSSAKLHRFDISKEVAETYVKKHWRNGKSRYDYDKEHKL